MKLETIQTPTTEIFVEGHNSCVTVNPWSNYEGASFMLHDGKDGALKLAGALRWEEIDLLMVAITAARA